MNRGQAPTSVQLPVPLRNPLYSSTNLPARSSSVSLGTNSPSGPTTTGGGTLFPPDMKKKKAVMNSMDPMFGRGGGPGGTMKPGGRPGELLPVDPIGTTATFGPVDVGTLGAGGLGGREGGGESSACSRFADMVGELKECPKVRRVGLGLTLVIARDVSFHHRRSCPKTTRRRGWHAGHVLVPT
jgi:hypothetical protein